MNNFIMAISLFLVAIAGCSSGASSGETEENATVSPDQEAKAATIIKNIDYLPFNYKADGCADRALYMAMELAVEQIPSSSAFVIGKLRPANGAKWQFHVAPMIEKVGSSDREIMDPSIESGVVSYDRWLQDIHPISQIRTNTVPGSTYASQQIVHDPNFQGPPMIAGFDQLPPFKKGDIDTACFNMWNFLHYQTPSRDDLQPKLIARTAELAKRLQALAKITGYTAGDTFSDCAEPFDEDPRTLGGGDSDNN